VNEPAVLLLDEPLSALDPQIREEMQTELARLQRELNMTFVMVTHDQDEALALSHRIAVFCQGNLEQVGKPEAIYTTPSTQFVASFIGQSNLFACTYLQSARGLHTVRIADGTEFNTIAAGDFSAASGDSCLLCVKPQAVDIYGETEPKAGDRAVNRLSGRIVNASYKGTSTEYVIAAGGVQVRAERQHGGSSLPLKAGDSVVLSFCAEDGWLLKDQSAAKEQSGSAVELQETATVPTKA
jgi:spermidine/putrescine transport system ATP-binding protein